MAGKLPDGRIGSSGILWTCPLRPRYHIHMRYVALILCCLPLACGPGIPDLDQHLSPAAQVAEYPSLVALGPLLVQADAPQPRSASAEGTSLEARAEALRRRAAWLRNMSL